MTAIPLRDEIFYPESDGQPMGESELHVVELINLMIALRAHFKGDPNVYVIGNLFLYYERGNPKAVLCPDIFVAKGVKKKPRRSYKLWEEGRIPCFVAELTSENTYQDDLKSKKDRYAQLGVEEYLLYDPWGEVLSPTLQGFRLAGSRYQPIEPEPDGSIECRSIGVRFRVAGDHLLAFDSMTGEPLPRMEN